LEEKSSFEKLGVTHSVVVVAVVVEVVVVVVVVVGVVEVLTEVTHTCDSMVEAKVVSSCEYSSTAKETSPRIMSSSGST
jgi:hypothetical protein